MMEKAIRDFPKQFRFSPKIENRTQFKRQKKYALCGVGGSHLAGDIVNMLVPSLDLVVHTDYGVPALPEKDLARRLIIISSYSGNTEEALDAFKQARARQLPVICVSTGGKLLEQARTLGVPYIELPNTGIQPRLALGFNLLALLKITNQKELFRACKTLAKTLRNETLEISGKHLAAKLSGRVPVIYSSRRNLPIAYNWKIKFNETGKIPAFHNVFPELNHNEMTGFDVTDTTRELSSRFTFIFLQDAADHERITTRLTKTRELYEARGLTVESVALTGATDLEKIFSSLMLADWTALALAQAYGLEPEQVPMVEAFKQLIA